MKKSIHPRSRIHAHVCAYAPPLPPPVPPFSLGKWRLKLYSVVSLTQKSILLAGASLIAPLTAAPTFLPVFAR
eukprot:3343011-Prymnesium_polylepis.1